MTGVNNQHRLHQPLHEAEAEAEAGRQKQQGGATGCLPSHNNVWGELQDGSACQAEAVQLCWWWGRGLCLSSCTAYTEAL